MVHSSGGVALTALLVTAAADPTDWAAEAGFYTLAQFDLFALCVGTASSVFVFLCEDHVSFFRLRWNVLRAPASGLSLAGAGGRRHSGTSAVAAGTSFSVGECEHPDQLAM